MLNLTSYTDETGHPDDPKVEYVGMAGFVAPRGAWELFESGWNDLLKNAGLVAPFHMIDFAHSNGQFRSWKGNEETRRAFLGRALNLIVETGATPVGAVVSTSSFKTLTLEQQSHFNDPYYLAFQNCTRGIAIQAVFEEPQEKVAMIYSYNPEYGLNNGGRAEQLWYAIKAGWDHGNRMGSYATGIPSDHSALQAADLFAYELSHEFENRVKRPKDNMRWGLRQILGMYRTASLRINLFDRKELLRIIKESNWPDQTGVEELGSYRGQSAQESMMKWLIERGGFAIDNYGRLFRGGTTSAS